MPMNKYFFIFAVILIAILGSVVWYLHGYAPATVDTSTTLVPYSNSQIGFALSYPSDWFVQFDGTEDGAVVLASEPREKNLHGPGIPGDEGSMWVDLVKGTCTPTTYEEEHDPDISEKTVCKDGFRITLGLWTNDPKAVEHKELLDRIAASMRAL